MIRTKCFGRSLMIGESHPRHLLGEFCAHSPASVGMLATGVWPSLDSIHIIE